MNRLAAAPHILAICNRKGGVGKTTTAVNVAAELASHGLRTLLVDLDSQGHCAVGLGVHPPPGAPTAHAIFGEPAARLADAVLPTPFAHLMLAPASHGFEHGSGSRDQGRLAAALADDAIASRFDVIVLDTPPSLDLLLLNALSAAHSVLVPYVPHPLSFEGIRQLMRVLFKVMSTHNPGLKVLGFLPVTCAEHVRQHRQTSADVGHQFGAHRVLAGIRNDIRLAEAFAAGKPIRHYAAHCRGAQDFAALGDALVRALAVESTSPFKKISKENL